MKELPYVNMFSGYDKDKCYHIYQNSGIVVKNYYIGIDVAENIEDSKYKKLRKTRKEKYNKLFNE